MKSVLYPGSFDPITLGHVDIIKRLAKLFDRVVVSVADNPRKNYSLPKSKRVELVQEALKKVKGVEVVSSQELTVSLARELDISIVARSVRSVTDWEYEYAMAFANQKLAPEVETFFIMANPALGHISSSLVREVAAFGGDVSAFVPENVKRELAGKSKKKSK